MQNTLRKLVSLGGIGGLVLITALTGCQSASTRSTGQKMSDRQLKGDVKKALKQDPTFKYTDVNANVYEGTIQLTGFVETPEQRLRAAELAARTRGAKQVINEIMLKSVPTGPVTIRDPLGRETGHLLLDTNAPVQHLRNLDEQGQPAPGQNGNR